MLDIAKYISVILLLFAIFVSITMNSLENYVQEKANRINIKKNIRLNKKKNIKKKVRFAVRPKVLTYELTREEIEMKQKAYRDIKLERMIEKVTSQLNNLFLEIKN